MKSIKLCLAALAFTALSSTAFSQTIINITGATAFRAAANGAIISYLGGAGVTEYAFTGTQGINGSNRAIFRGNVTGFANPVIIRASWSGSTAGIAAIANATPVEVLTTANPMSTAGTNLGQGGNPAPVFENAVAQFAFSDVAQTASTTQSPVLNGSEVGVVPFVFVMNEGAPAEVTTMTDQLMNALYSNGAVPLWYVTGGDPTLPANQILVYAVGRNDGSGSRATALSETRYGVFLPVQQFTGTQSGNTINTLSFVGNGGYSSNSGIRDLVSCTSAAVSVEGGPAESCFVISYLTLSDALAAQTAGAKLLEYNGVPYSEFGTKRGPYTFWGYQWFYDAPAVSGNTTLETFRNAFTALIPTTLNPAVAFPIPDMTVIRSGGDGGPVLP
jgi:hypothetical protein